MSRYQPPLTLTTRMIVLIAEISEQIGQLSAGGDSRQTPHLRRGNRIRTIQASLAIENNTLSVEQVTAVLAGQRVLGLPKEIQEVRNAFKAIANESAGDLVTDSVTDLVAKLLLTLGPRSLRISDLMAEMSLVHKATFRSNYLKPALTAGMIEMTDPQSPKNPTQKYRLTQLGKMMVKKSQC